MLRSFSLFKALIFFLLCLNAGKLVGQNGQFPSPRYRDCEIVTCGNQVIQQGQSVQLWASGVDFFQWSPVTGLSDPSSSNPVASPTVTTTYTVVGFNSGENLVYNGDFELGNVGFTSQYIYQSNLNPEGTYYLGNNAHTFHGGFTGIDHTTGTGNFMIVNGAKTANTIAWSQTINVVPNTDYAFSTWVCNLSPYSEEYLAQLQFSINGVQIGNIFKAPLNVGVWNQFYEIWNSGTATQAVITILNQNINGLGNDFGLDDISFTNLTECSSSAQLTVYVGDYLVVNDITPPLPICEGGSFSLTVPQVSGGTGWTGEWQVSASENGPFTTLNNSAIPSSYNGYYLRYAVTFQGNNYYSNVVRLTVIPKPVAFIEAEEEVLCQGESVTLHAGPSGTSGIAVGDILCTDNSFVKPSAWPVSGKTAKGIVFYIDSSGQHGWAAGLEFHSNLAWSTETVDIPTLPNITHWRDAICDFDGYSNTQKIRNFGNSTKYPAAWAVDFEHGWYLPAAGQLNILYGVMTIVNNSLTVVGGTPYPVVTGGWRGWSSSEWSYNYAIGVYEDGDVGFTTKTENYGKVREVISF